MPVTMHDVREVLDAEEPDYTEGTRLGRNALPFLEELLTGNDAGLASKATYLAGLIGGEGATPILEKAATNRDPRIRVAAAAVATHLTDESAARVLLPLVADVDIAVQKVALRSVPSRAPDPLKRAVEDVRSKGVLPAIAGSLTDALQQIRK